MLLISFSVDQKDYLQYQLFSASQSKALLNRTKRTTWIVPILYLFMALVSVFMGNYMLPGVFIVIAAGWALGYPIFQRKRYLKYITKSAAETYGTQADTISYELTDNLLHGKSAQGESSIYIEQITTINEIQDYFYVRLKRGATIIFPKSKLANKAALEEWLRSLSQRQNIPYITMLDWAW